MDRPAIEDVEPLVLQVSDPWREDEPEDIGDGEQMVGEAAGVRKVLSDPPAGGGGHQAVETIRRFKSCRGDLSDMKRRVLVGDVGIKFRAGSRSVSGVDKIEGVAPAPGRKELPVGRGCRALAPEPSQGQGG